MVTRHKKIGIALAIIILSVFIIHTVCNDDGYSKIVGKYQKFEKEISQIAEYLEGLDATEVYIAADENDDYFAYDCSHVPVSELVIEEDTVLRSLTVIWNAGCDCITKEGPCIYFQFIANLDDGWGILYMCENTAPPSKDSSGISLVKKLIESNVYYYRTDLNGVYDEPK